ncbi:PAS domain S-box protein [bacterium]|nr:PAS domain S-box protein [bacterium]RQV94566.1 MAG: PAS domain S-box protein [bacterium]
MKLTNKIATTFFLMGIFYTGIMLWSVRTKLFPPLFYFIIPIITGFIGYLLTIIFLKSIHKLNEGSKIIYSGNYEYQLNIDSKDEIGQIAKTVENMADDLKQTHELMYQSKEEIENLKEIKLKLQEREEYYRRLFEYSNDAVFIYDFDGYIIDVNKKASIMLGYTKEEFCQIPFLELQTEEELTKSKAAFRTSSNTGSVRFDSVFQKKDGSPIHVEISSSIVDLKKGIMQSIVSNITERKEIEQSLRESEEKFRTFMETANDLMYMTDANGNITYVNKAMLNTLGYLKEEIIGMPFYEILCKESLEDSKKKRQEFLQMNIDTHELIWETKTRKKITGEMKTVAIYDDDGHFEGMRGIFRDITERKKIEESQRLTQLGKLAADMAHEVKNQLMVIATRTKICLMRKPSDQEIEKDIQIIANQCEQVNSIVNRLLTFSKPSKGDFKEVDINDTIDFVVNLVEKQFSHNNVQIVKNYLSSPPIVKVDEKQMQEVFLNLLRNAFDAMTDQKGLITISTLKENEHLQIDIADTGIGIPESSMKNIFHPFFTTKEHGTGLGLSVCYGIIKAHNGDLKYTSTPGKGTIASVSLPIYHQDNMQSAAVHHN